MTDRVLIVDDDSIFRSEFKDCFQEYGIAEASSGEEALKILKRPHEIDLVILDVILPKENGYRVSRFIKDDIKSGVYGKDIATRADRQLSR